MMSTTKKPPKPEGQPLEAELAVYSFLCTKHPTPEECRLAVRQLLREASNDLERRR